MPGIHAPGISRYLAHRGFTRSHGIHAGFNVTTTAQTDHVCVMYRLGTYGVDMTPQERRKAVSQQIHRMKRELAKRYTVTVHKPTEGWHPFWLRVTPRTEITNQETPQ